MEQKTIKGFNTTERLGDITGNKCGQKYLLVCDSAFKYLKIKDTVSGILKDFVAFDGFTPNPKYEDVCKGVEIYRENGCNAIVAIGGGSAIDVAKCIKLFSVLPPDKNYLEQPFIDSNVPLIAIPTTAGTGSEATHFAVIYYSGKKISVAHESILPDYVLLDPALLETLPIYQKKCTMLDALCHGIESWWSVNSTEESKRYSKEAVEKIIRYKDKYLDGDKFAAEQILTASNLSGKAINISKTTAAHAMSYKLTSMYNLPHGHAVAVCLAELWEFMYNHADKCVDARGKKYLINIFECIACALGEDNIINGIEKFDRILKDLQIYAPEINVGDLKVLVSSVNTERLQNNPVALTENDLTTIYRNLK